MAKRLEEIIQDYRTEYSDDKLVEEDTKAKLIQKIFDNVLEWKESKIQRERTIGSEGQIKRADYAYPKSVPRVIVEAKRLGVDREVARGDYDKQVQNYAYSKAVNWGILTNFKHMKAWYITRDEIYPFWSIDLLNDDISEIISKLKFFTDENIFNGTLEKEAKNRNYKTQQINITGDLSNSLNVFREKMIRYLNDEYKTFDNTLKEELTQGLINRLIFIKKVEAEELEEKRLEQIYRNTSTHVYSKVREVFVHYRKEFDTDIFGKPDEKSKLEEIDIPDNVIQKLLDVISKPAPNIEYNFAAVDVNVLGNIYESYLAYIQKGKKLVGGDEKRKAQGIYYTPQYIVDTIVEETIGREKGSKIKSLKILDPACGSGSFLIGSIAKLDTYYKDQIKGYEDFSPSKKLDTIKNNIYGVDLDERAISIAKLSVYLKLLTLNTKQKMVISHESLLPELRENLKVGNSLIEDEVIDNDFYFKWAEKFKSIMDNGKFDVIIGNPPYINAIELSKTVGDKVKNYWKTHFDSAKGTYDIYILFFEQALKLCKEGGYVSFITPNKYLSSPYGVALRELVSRNYTLVKVIDFSSVKVFNDPSVYPIITVIQNKKPTKPYTISIEKIYAEDMHNKKEHTISSKVLSLLPEYNWGIILSNNAKLIEKIFENAEPLEKVAKVNATSTASEADEYSAFISENSGVKLINTGTIDRYSTTYGIDALKNKGKSFNKPKLELSKVSENRKTLYNTPKIIFAKIALKPEGFLDVKGEYASLNTNCVYSPKEGYSLEYLSAILNSQLMNFIYSELFSGLRMGGGYFQFQAPQLKILPIMNCSEDQKKKISDLVRKLITSYSSLNESANGSTSKKESIMENIERTENDLNNIIYKVYGITEEEKQMIENSLK